MHAQRLTALHVLKPQEVQKWLTATAAAEPIVLGRPWFVAIQQQLTAVPNDAATLDDELRAAILQLKQAAPQYLSSAVRAVATLVALPGVDAGIAVDALVRASTASNRVVAETAMRTLDAIRPGWARFYQEHSNHGSPTTISNPGGTGTSRAGLADVLSSQAVLVGVSQYLNLPSVPHVENNLRAIAEVLGDRDLWGLPPERLRMLPNPSSAMDVIEAVGQAAAQVEVDGLLLVYFAGHGLLDERTGQPILALSGTSVEDAGMTGLPYSWIRESIESSEARHRVFILDCSFPRRVFGSDAFWRNLSPNNDTSPVKIGSEPAQTSVLWGDGSTAVPNEACTTFTNALVSVLSEGIPGQAATIDLQMLHQEILTRTGKLSPPVASRLLSADTGRHAQLTRNAAHHDGQAPDNRSACDIVIFTTTPTEFRATRDVFETSDPFKVVGDQIIFPGFVSTKRANGTLSVGVALITGPQDAASRAVHTVRRRQQPKALFLVSNATVKAGHLKLGDIVIPTSVSHYKPNTSDGDEDRPDTAVIDPAIRHHLNLYSLGRAGFSDAVRRLIARLRTEDRPPDLAAHFEPTVRLKSTTVATGTRLISDNRALVELQSQFYPQVVVAEPTAWNFAAACTDGQWGIFHGISGYSDANRSGQWEYVAASCAALFLRSFLEHQYLPPHTNEP